MFAEDLLLDKICTYRLDNGSFIDGTPVASLQAWPRQRAQLTFSPYKLPLKYGGMRVTDPQTGHSYVQKRRRRVDDPDHPRALTFSCYRRFPFF